MSLNFLQIGGIVVGSLAVVGSVLAISKHISSNNSPKQPTYLYSGLSAQEEPITHGGKKNKNKTKRKK
jgi:hypothetical protein